MSIPTHKKSNQLFTIGYLDVTSNNFVASKNTYTDIASAAYDINYTIQSTILKKFDVLLPNKFSFVPNNEQASFIDNIKLEYGKYLVIHKNEYIIDIYLKKEKKGYIYNSNENEHVLKFFINEHTLGENEKIAFSEEINIKLENIEDIETDVVEVLLNNNHENLIKELREKIKKYKKD